MGRHKEPDSLRGSIEEALENTKALASDGNLSEQRYYIETLIIAPLERAKAKATRVSAKEEAHGSA